MSKDVCNQCGQKKSLGHHWQRSSECEYPQYSKHEREVLTGVVFGDGSVYRGGSNPKVECDMISKGYLEYLFEIFGNKCNSIKDKRSSSEAAELARETGFSPSAKAENYSDIYRLTWRSNPYIEEFSWYDSGKDKFIFPESMKLTETILLHWYVCDGNLTDRDNRKPYVKISCSNGRGEQEKISSYFSDSNLPEPKWETYKRGGCGKYSDTENTYMQWSVEDSRILLDYMRKSSDFPLPDFSYKFPDQKI